MKNKRFVKNLTQMLVGENMDNNQENSENVEVTLFALDHLFIRKAVSSWLKQICHSQMSKWGGVQLEFQNLFMVMFNWCADAPIILMPNNALQLWLSP